MRVPFQKKPSESQRQYILLTLSPEGIREAENFDGQGSEFEVLAALNQKRPQSIGSLAKASNLSFNECLKCCKELKMKGYVQQIARSQ